MSSLIDAPPQRYPRSPRGRRASRQRGRGGGRLSTAFYRPRPVYGNSGTHPATTATLPLTTLPQRKQDLAANTKAWQQPPPIPSGNGVSSGRGEMDKTPSNSNIDRMAYAIMSKAPRDITLQDFDSHDSADGISLLLTMVVNQIYSLKDLVLSPSQLARLAAHAAVIHPTLLLEYLMNDNTALEFCTRALATRPLFLEADLVCPMDTPYLLTDVTIFRRRELSQVSAATNYFNT